MNDRTSAGDSQPKRIFISYGHDDLMNVADRLREDLIARGHEVWFDAERIKTGGDWERYIEEGLDWASQNDSGRIILLMTPHSVRRPDGYCLNELARAILRSIRILPVMLIWCEPPLSICRIQWLDMQDCVPLTDRIERYQSKFTVLIDALEHDRIDFEGFHASLLNLLKPLSFDAEIKYNLDQFTGRVWIFELIDEWLLRKQSRIFWIIGSPGVGKSAISSWLCAHRREVTAFHFCRFDNIQKRDPRRCVMSIAYQISTQLPAYEERLKSISADDIGNMNAKTLFDHLIVQPLSGIPAPDKDMVILIDALDEASVNGKNELCGFIASEFERTPEWLRLIITSRPDPEVMGPLQAFRPFVIDISDPRNDRDIRMFLAQELKTYNGGIELPGSVIESIVKKSDGLFLYAEWIARELASGSLSLEHVEEFPQGLGGIYLKFFDRQFPDIKEWESGVRPALEVLSALQEPVDIKALSKIFNWNVHEERKFRRSMGSLFLFDGQVRPFHKSLMEWLTNEDKEDPYLVSIPEGHRTLADYGLTIYRSGEASWSAYLIMYLPDHLYLSGKIGELREILGDLKFIRKAWEKDRFNLMRQWTFLEESTPLRMKDVYHTVIVSPEKADDVDLMSLAYLLKCTFNHDEALPILRYLKNYYEHSGSTGGTQEVLGNLAWILINRSDFNEAMTLLKEQERICRDTGNMLGLQNSLLYQANIHHFKNDFDRAMELLREQESICRKIDNIEGIQESLSLQSLILRVRGDLPGAMALAVEQEALCRESGNLDGMLSSLMAEGLILRMMGRMDEAMAVFKKQESISRRIGNKDMFMGSLYGTSMLLRMKGETDAALSMLRECEALCRKLENKFAVGEALGEEAIALRSKGDLDAAMAILNEREQISLELGDRFGLQFSYGNEAIILRMKGDLDGAMRLHKDEERICREIGHKRDLAMSFSNQAIILRMKGDLDAAMALHKVAEKALREIGYKYGLQDALGEQAMTLFAKGDVDRAIALLKEQASICSDMGLKNDLKICNDRQLQLLSSKISKIEKESV
jgi:tetratricopeptide (TPR) repeat protein